jgi:hypothetical protein
MAERRSLVAGLTDISPEIDPKLAEDFILHGTPKSAARPKERKEPPFQTAREPARTPEPAPAATLEQPEAKDGQSNHMGRAPLTIRFRTKTAKALKNASLDRQMRGLEPYKLQDILELVVEPWLHTNGYLN